MHIIEVVPAEKGKWSVNVDHVQEGILYCSPALANREAKRLHDKNMPFAELKLISLDPIPEVKEEEKVPCLAQAGKKGMK